MRVAVIIPTTEGPAKVLRLTPLAQAPRSVLRTQDDYRPLPPSSRYHAFVQPGGPLAERIGIRAGQFELRLGAMVETGRSWELPVAIAHWLHACGHQLDSEVAELVIWATGTLDNDLRVLTQDYHLPTKLNRSGKLLKEWLDRGVPVLALVPEGISLPRELVHSQLTLHRVADLAEAIGVIGKALASEPNGVPEVRLDSPASHGRFLLVAGAGLLVAALLWIISFPLTTVAPLPSGVISGFDQADGSLAIADMVEDAASSSQITSDADGPGDGSSVQRMDERPSTPPAMQVDAAYLAAPPRVILHHAPEGTNCRSVVFGTDAARREDLAAGDDGYGTAVSRDLCSIGFLLPETAPEQVEIALQASIINHILPSDRRDRIVLRPGESWLFRLRADLPAMIETDFSVTSSGAVPLRLRLVLQETP